MDPKLLAVKLLALAMDQAGKPEGELARRKLEELMTNYGIVEADIYATEAQSLVQKRKITLPAEGWALDLLTGVAYFCACVTLKLADSQVLVFGKPFHFEVTAIFYEHILRQLDEKIRDTEGSGLWHVDKIEDWRASFALGVEEKLVGIATQALSDPFSGVRRVCIRAAESALYEFFPGAGELDNFSRGRTRVQAAFDSGLSVDGELASMLRALPSAAND